MKNKDYQYVFSMPERATKLTKRQLKTVMIILVFLIVPLIAKLIYQLKFSSLFWF